MKEQDFSISFLTDRNPQQAFEQIKNVRSWWTGVYGEEIEGETEKLGDEFTFRAGGGAHYSKQKLTELTSGKKIVWQVTDSKLDFLKDKNEWTGTELVFDFSREQDKTRVVFTHRGLTPSIECFRECSNGWTAYFNQTLRPAMAG